MQALTGFAEEAEVPEQAPKLRGEVFVSRSVFQKKKKKSKKEKGKKKKKHTA